MKNDGISLNLHCEGRNKGSDKKKKDFSPWKWPFWMPFLATLLKRVSLSPFAWMYILCAHLIV